MQINAAETESKSSKRKPDGDYKTESGHSNKFPKVHSENEQDRTVSLIDLIDSYTAVDDHRTSAAQGDNAKCVPIRGWHLS